MLKKISLIISVIAVLLTVIPTCAEEAATPAKIKAGDILCFGTPDEACGFDGKWLVLDAEHTNMGTDGLFLVSLNLIGGENGSAVLFRDIGDVSVSFSNRGEAYAQDHPGVTDYQGSDLQRWLAEFLESHFSEAERQAILPTVKSDAGIAIPGFGIPLPGAAAGTVDFDPVKNILNGDKLFPLSAEEAVSAAYGFAGNASRVALYKDAANGYWLRSPHIPTFPLDVGFVFSFGAVMDYPVNAKSMFAMDTYTRPACNLDRASITGLEPLSVISSKTIWRVTFQGDGLSEQVYDLHLPEIAKVPDVQHIIYIVLIALPVFLLALVGMAIWLILRRVRKKRKAFQSTLLKGA